MKTRVKSVARLVTDAVDSGLLPFVALDSVESRTGRLLDVVPLPEVDLPVSGAASIRAGDVLFGKLRPYLAKAWVADRSAYASTELLCMRPGPQVDSRWLGYLACSQPFVDWAIATSDGTKMPRTSWEKISQLRVGVPPLGSQRAIADYLDRETARIDALIAAKRRMMALLEERWQVMLETRIRALAQEFGDTPLKFVCREIVVGIVITPSAWYADSGVPAIRGTNVSPGAISLDNLVFLTPEGDALHTKSRLRCGDVVVVRTGQAGAAAVVPPELEGANCIDLVIVRVSREYSPEFLEYVLNSDWMQKHIDERSVGTIQSHFNVGAASIVPVPQAPRTDQSTAVAELGAAQSRMKEVVSVLDRQIRLLRERRQALITAAVTGQLDLAEAV